MEHRLRDQMTQTMAGRDFDGVDGCIPGTLDAAVFPASSLNVLPLFVHTWMFELHCAG